MMASNIFLLINKFLKIKDERKMKISNNTLTMILIFFINSISHNPMWATGSSNNAFVFNGLTSQLIHQRWVHQQIVVLIKMVFNFLIKQAPQIKK